MKNIFIIFLFLFYSRFSYAQQKDNTPGRGVAPCPQPILIFPADESVLTDHNPLFNWAALNMVGANDKISFSIHVKEILTGQTKEEAMRSNLEVFSEPNIANNTQWYPPSAKPLENGKKYCWQLYSYLNDELCAQSEVWQFEFEQPQYKSNNPAEVENTYAVLKRELDGGYYPLGGDTLSFRLDDAYNKGIVNYKIYKSQSQIVNGSMPVLYRRPSDNFFDLNLGGLALASGYYVLEVTTEKSERWMLKFKK